MSITVKTPARLHFGVLNPSGETVRRFGGVGLSVKGIGFELEIEQNQELEIDGPEEQVRRVRKIVEKLSKICDIPLNANIRILDSIPTHVGLGSTTQLTLALGKSLTILFDKDVSVMELARDTGRGKRSGIGTYVFEKGGFIVEGGGTENEFPPLIFRHDFPENWRFVVAVPKTERGPAEEGEGRYFENLEKKENISREICYLLVLDLLPALVKKNISNFGEALTKIDENVGRAFSTKQEGLFKDGPVSVTRNFMLDNGAYGVGQSSWGPTVYGLVRDQDQAKELKDDMEKYLRTESLLDKVNIVKPDNSGAEIIRD